MLVKQCDIKDIFTVFYTIFILVKKLLENNLGLVEETVDFWVANGYTGLKKYSHDQNIT